MKMKIKAALHATSQRFSGGFQLLDGFQRTREQLATVPPVAGSSCRTKIVLVVCQLSQTDTRLLMRYINFDFSYFSFISLKYYFHHLIFQPNCNIVTEKGFTVTQKYMQTSSKPRFANSAAPN
jgi:hypothetical protein